MRNLDRWLANRRRCAPLLAVPESVQEALDERANNVADGIASYLARHGNDRGLVEAMARIHVAGLFALEPTEETPRA